MQSLFQPKKIKNLEIKNRIVLPPMVCFSFAEENGFVSDKNVNHYKSIVEGGAGLVIVEATCVNKKGKLSQDQLEIGSDDYIEGLKRIADVCHEKDTSVFIQLHHAGLRTSKSINEDTITSSDYNDGRVTARALTLDEIKSIENDFINAAIRAEKAGFDGVEIHGAHSYLLTQFFSDKVNKREDEYGGSLENRLRIAKNIINGIREKVNEEFVVGIRMGCNENSLEYSVEMAKAFEAMGMDYLNLSTGFDNTQIHVEIPEDFPCNWIVYGATKIRENVNIPVVAVNMIDNGEKANYLIEKDLVDFVAIGRAFLADHNFAKHIKNEEPIVTCLKCKPCSWFSNGDNCPRHRVK